ncbi:MAG: hypothetical protein U0Q04_05650 [Microbacterium sp.]
MVVAVPVLAVGDHITDGDDGSRRLEVVFGLSFGGDLRPAWSAADALRRTGNATEVPDAEEAKMTSSDTVADTPDSIGFTAV